jgi:hypothetical protein
MSSAATDRMPVEDALTELHGEGLHDAAIAEQLRSLGYGRGWTRRKVCYWRNRVLAVWDEKRERLVPVLRRHAPRRGWKHARQKRAVRWRLYQEANGLGHLLPQYDRDRREWGPGHELRPCQVRVLAMLRDAPAPMTAAQIAQSLGLASRRSLYRPGDKPVLDLLVLAGLVTQTPGSPATYAASDAARRPTERRRPTRHAGRRSGAGRRG